MSGGWTEGMWFWRYGVCYAAIYGCYGSWGLVGGRLDDMVVLCSKSYGQTLCERIMHQFFRHLPASSSTVKCYCQCGS